MCPCASPPNRGLPATKLRTKEAEFSKAVDEDICAPEVSSWVLSSFERVDGDEWTCDSSGEVPIRVKETRSGRKLAEPGRLKRRADGCEDRQIEIVAMHGHVVVGAKDR